jgi:hypothetical protein
MEKNFNWIDKLHFKGEFTDGKIFFLTIKAKLMAEAPFVGLMARSILANCGTA